MKPKWIIAIIAAAFTFLSHAAFAAKTIEAIKSRGELICGVSTGLGGFSLPDSKGKWTGLDVDICKAIAAAILGNANMIKFIPLSTQQRFTALQSGEVDILSRNTTWSLTRDTALGLNFTAITYYDGQGFLVPKALGVKSAKELDGATVCIQPGTTSELNLADYFRTNNMQFTPVVIESLQELNAAFFAGRCDAYTTDASGLASTRLNDAPKGKSDDYEILPETISKEPLGPVVRHGDDQFLDIVKWVIFGLIEAEEFGITTANVREMSASSTNPAIKRLLGTNPGMGRNLGLDEAWMVNAILAVGNYGEIWDRNIPPLGLSRGLNKLWSNGGIMYSPPVR
ncbi:MAG: putative amino-acid ABC transporter-binding protein YhdW [Hyphomicrobiaceae bacterium hypho_1]